MAKKKQTEQQRLRKFGLVMAVAFGLLGAFLLWRERPAGPYLLYVGAAFLLVGLVLPKALSPVEHAWMAFARLLQIVVTAVILTVTFYVMITPLGLIMRVIGKETLGKKGDPSVESYWVPPEPDGPHTRPDQPY